MISIIIDVEQLKDGRLTAYMKPSKVDIVTKEEVRLAVILQTAIGELMSEITLAQSNSRYFSGKDLDKLVTKIKSDVKEDTP